MLWSLLKVLIFFALLGLIALGAGLLQQVDSAVLVRAFGVEFSLGPAEIVIFLIILVVALWVVLKLAGLLVAVLRFINGDETALSRYFDRNREYKGFNALSDAMMALANGDAQEALAKAKRADHLLNKPHLTNLVVAQAAEQKGDAQTATETYKKLLADPKTKFVGVRGLLKQKLAEGKTDTALALAEKAMGLKPQHVATQNALFELQTKAENWDGARKTLNIKLKHGNVPRDLHRRRDAVMALAQAIVQKAGGDDGAAKPLALDANRLSPGLVPAAVMVAQDYMDDGKPKLALRVLKAAWGQSPHPDLAAQYAALEPDEDTKARIKRFLTLIKTTPNHPESRMTMAELYLADGDYAQAEASIKTLIADDPTQRSLTIMAAVQRGMGGPDDQVQDLLTQAMTAPRDPDWICDNCGHAHAEWGVICQACDGFDTMAWKRPSMTQQNNRLAPLLSAPAHDGCFVGS